MQWIDQADLRNWAERIGSREHFPVMVRDLILASARDIGDIQHLRFPGGESSQVRGYDGDLTMSSAFLATTYVPAGRSVWEFGVNDDPAKKFRSDYAARIKGTAGKAERKKMTFVFVTPRNWDNPKEKLPDFLKQYKDKGDFADVNFIDGAMLETWLGEHSAVGAKHARLVLGHVPNLGARSIEEFWIEFSNRYNPTLTEEVALAARAEQAQHIVEHLKSARGPLVFIGDGPDEVSAVAVAAIRKSDEDIRRFIEARTLIVDSDAAGRALTKADRYGFILSPTVQEVGGLLANYGPTVSTLDYRPSGSGYPRLERPSVRQMSDALKSMNFEEEQAETLARKSGRSLTILHRHAAKVGFKLPSWAQDGERLVPALLAGSWSTQQSGDLEVLMELSGIPYAEHEGVLRSYLRFQDTPIDLMAGIWRLRAPVDAFVNLSPFIDKRHIEGLGAVSRKIFGSATSPEMANERFGSSNEPYSSLLREGVATSLLIVAAMHKEVGLEIGMDPEAFVNDLVAGLPGLRDDIRVILGLEQQLTYLMEAAPRPLLSALELLLEGEEAVAILFAESMRFGFANSQLPNLLWALEMQAWDPTYFRRVSLLLAKLASKDPGGKSGSRPISSLRDIFIAWFPGTNAPLAERIAVIDEIVALYPPVGWQLLSMLLPKMHETKGPTQRPRYREAGASDREVLTNRVVIETYEAVTDRALSMLGEDTAAWLEVAEAFPDFTHARRVQFLDMLAAYATQVYGEDRVGLRRALRRIADRHSRFRQADWVLPDDDLERLKSIVSSLGTSDPFDQARALFDESPAYSTDDFAAEELAIEKQRANAIVQLAAAEGAKGVARLARVVRFPRMVGYAAAGGIADEGILQDLLDDGNRDGPASELSTAVAGALRRLRGAEYDLQFLAQAKKMGWSQVRTASMLLDWPEEPKTWDLVATLGIEAGNYFWFNRRPFRFDRPLPELETLVNHFLVAGRAASALAVVHPRENELSWSTVTAILSAWIDEANGSGLDGNIDSYRIGELFKSLRNRLEIDQLELAQWEYAFFPVLQRQDSNLALYDRMASDPGFYVSILKDVFVADHVDPGEEESTKEQRNRSSISHSILIHNKKVPGERDGLIDQDSIDAWVDGVFELGRRERLTKIVPSFVGRTLAHAAETDGVWPPQEVAKLIERLRSDDVERSIMIERSNMRGVYVKALFEGGQQERDLASQYRRWAGARISFPRTKAMLLVIAERWDRAAKEADEEAVRDRIKFE